MVKNQQVRRLVKLRKNEKTLTMAAARAGLSRKTARKYLKSGKLPSQCQPERYWRTRSDPFESVWPEVEEILKRSPTVEATAVFEHLCRQQEGAFQQGQLRTLQRRIKQWKAEHGEAKEVMFPQKYRPGHQAQSDFTFMGRLGVTIQGQPFPHLLYHFVLAYSNWEATTLCFSESFESLSLGLQNALWELGALPEEHRTDRLSAAVNNLKREEFTERYQGLLNHFGMRSSRTQAGKAHENGDVEQAHHRLKRAIEQELLLRCSRDFSSREEYEGFVAVIVDRRNAARQKRLGEELAVMRPLPARRLDDFTRQWVRVSPSSTIRGSPQHLFGGQPVDRRAGTGEGVGRSGGGLLRGSATGGKTHLVCALGQELILLGRRVLFSTCALLVQRLLRAKIDLTLEKELKKLDRFEGLIVDDIGYVQQSREEMEVLFTLLAHRYERRSILLTSNLIFSDWERIFKDPMTTAAAIDRLVHHSVILELNVSSYRMESAKKQQQENTK